MKAYVVPSGCPVTTAVAFFFKLFCRSFGDAVPYLESSTASVPATAGEDIEVPERNRVSRGPPIKAASTLTPSAKTSRTRPKLEKDAILLLLSTAPTVTIVSSLAGDCSFALRALFPAAATKCTRICMNQIARVIARLVPTRYRPPASIADLAALLRATLWGPPRLQLMILGRFEAWACLTTHSMPAIMSEYAPDPLSPRTLTPINEAYCDGHSLVRTLCCGSPEG